MKPRWALVVALVLAAAVPSGAHAAAPVTIGPGAEPAVTVDPASGTAYVAWIGTEPSTTSLHFCRLPRGAPACDLNYAVAVPGTSLSRPFVTVDGATVRIYTYRYGLSGPRFNAIYALTSLDRGVSFDPGVQVGTIDFYDAIRGPGSTISFAADNSALFQQVPDDASSFVGAAAHLADDHPYVPSLAATPAGLLAVFANGSGAAQFRLHTSGDPNDINTWSPAQDFSTFAGYMRLATGPSGAFLLSDNAAGNLVVQRFTGSGFGPPVALPGPADALTGGSDDMVEDPSGRLHVVWPLGDAAGSHIGYASSDDGARWTAGTLEAGPNPQDLAQAPGAMHLSVAPDHLGVAVWQDSGSPRQVHAMAIGPTAVAPPAIGKTADASVVSGSVRVKLKGSRKFVALSGDQQVPLGSTFDTTKGTVALDTSAGAGKPLQHGEFGGAQFTPRQTRKNPLTTLSLSGGGLAGCRPPVPNGGSAARKRRRSLVASVKGRFRTLGRNAAASARGAKWTMTDTCGGTLTVVGSGTVVVIDFTLRKNRTLHAGQRYTARAPLTAHRRGNR